MNKLSDILKRNFEFKNKIYKIDDFDNSNINENKENDIINEITEKDIQTDNNEEIKKV